MNALLVEAIQDPAGTEIFDTSLEIDRWKLIGNNVNRNFNGASNGETIVEWERDDFEINGTSILKLPIGTGMSCINGIWSFPRKGLYKIDIMLVMQVQANDAEYGAKFKVSRDSGSTYDEYARLYHANVEVDNLHHTVSASHFINVSSIEGSTAVYFKLESYGMDDSNVSFKGDSGDARGTSVSITKLGPAV